MKKQTYQKPAMRVVKIQHSQMLCGSITGVESGEPSMSNSIDGWGNGGEDNEELTI